MGTWSNKKCEICKTALTDERFLQNGGRCNKCVSLPKKVVKKGELPKCPMCDGLLRHVQLKNSNGVRFMISCDFCQELWDNAESVIFRNVNKQFTKQ